MIAWRLARRMARRQWREGALKVVALALLVAVAAVTAVSAFNDRVEQALQLQAHALLGGDLVVESGAPLEDGIGEMARRLGLEAVPAVTFPTMVMGRERARLVRLMAVGEGYPPRGRLVVGDGSDHQRPLRGAPPPGRVWVAPALLSALDLAPGDSLTLGAARFTVDGVLVSEPAVAGGLLFTVAPRVMMSLADLDATALLGPGSRARHRLYLAGEAEALERFREELERSGGERLRLIEGGRPEVVAALDRARSFLGLASLVSVILAGVAVALASGHYVRSRLDECAVLRCLGASQGLITRLHLGVVVAVGMVAALAGVALGYGAQLALAHLLGGMTDAPLPPPGPMPALWGVAVGMVTLAGFALPPLWSLRRVPALRVLRRELGGAGVGRLALYGAALAAVAALLVAQAGEVRLALFVLAGLAATVAALALLAWMAIRPLRAVRGGASGWRLGLVAVARRQRASVAQVVGFGIGLMALLLLTVVRGDLVAQWQASIPADAPNRFVVNIQSDQVEPLRDFLAAEGLGPVRLAPMVRARLVAIDGEPVVAERFESERARHLALREFNLSWSETLQEGNRVVAGRWWRPGAVPGWSVEEGLAATLGLEPGQRLAFSIAGERVEAPIVSLRKVAWDSFRTNFFVVASPGLLETFPATYITSFHLPAGREALTDELVARFPNVTVLDVGQLMAQVRLIIERVSLAVEFVFVFTLLAGLLVMYAAVQAGLDERAREGAILRALGGRRRQLVVAQVVEFGLLGLVAGAVAATAASLVGALLARRLFQLPYAFEPGLWLIGMAAGAVVVGAAGVWSTRAVVRRPPLSLLR